MPIAEPTLNDVSGAPIRTKKFAKPAFFRFRLIADPFAPIVAPQEKQPT
jgi:hypothetical protein